MDLNNNTIGNRNQLGGFDNEEKEVLKYKISHLVSANRLKLYIRIDLIDSESTVNYEDIINYIKEQGIVYGINEEEIITYCNKMEFSKELAAATGLSPISGKDAELIYDFDTSNENKLREKEDGTIDFFNLNNVANVKKDDVLCHIIPEKEGTDGIDIYANKISYKRGKKAYFNNGKNTYITEDGLQLCSSTDGCVKMVGSKVVVEDVYTVDNVDIETGNIDFPGSVVINGDIKAGFSVKAKQDIKIRGLVEGAYIEAGGEVVISKGMNGMGKGTIHAKGNITSKYIENSTVKSEKSIYSETLINSDATANESIILKGPNASIIGGTSRAGDLIYAPTVGSKTNPETNLIIDLGKYKQNEDVINKLKKEKLELKKIYNIKIKELEDLEDKMNIILRSNIENKNVLHKSLIFKKAKVNNEISEIKKKLEKETPTDNIASHRIICKGKMYVNTRISIGWMRYKVRQDVSYSKIYNDGSDIVIVPLNPSDII
nr:FapA family protein [Sedimentibacter sp.]